MSDASTCPPRQQLLALLDDAEPSAETVSHVGTCADCREALASAAGDVRIPRSGTGEIVPARLRAALRDVPRELPADDVPHVPGFEIHAEIGRGGTAVVYKATQLALGRPVALKVLRADVAARPEALHRLRRGVGLLASIDHPGVVRVLQAGEFEGTYYVAQEYAAGGSLAARLTGTPWPVDDAVAVFRELCDAVAELHRRGVVHRDLKPENVLFREHQRAADGRFGVVLADFGLACHIDDADSLAPSHIAGTPGRMAPEAARGERVTQAADVWALGTILRDLLGENPPGRWGRVMKIGLDGDPRRRYRSAIELVADLREVTAAPARSGAVTAVAAAAAFAAVLWAMHLRADADAQRREAHRLRLDIARMRLDRGDRAGAWIILERCERAFRDGEWHELWRKSEPDRQNPHK